MLIISYQEYAKHNTFMMFYFSRKQFLYLAIHRHVAPKQIYHEATVVHSYLKDGTHHSKIITNKILWKREEEKFECKMWKTKTATQRKHTLLRHTKLL
jgi:hypothetical protein